MSALTADPVFVQLCHLPGCLREARPSQRTGAPTRWCSDAHRMKAANITYNAKRKKGLDKLAPASQDEPSGPTERPQKEGVPDMASVSIEGVAVPKTATAKDRPDLFGARGQLRPDGDGGIVSMMNGDTPEYATPSASKVDNGFYVTDRGLPWHVTLARQLGEVELMNGVDKLLTTAEAVKAAGLDWSVSLQKLTIAGTDIEVPGKFATVRSDTGQALGVVGRAYRVLDNADAFAFADDIVDSGEAKWETAGSLKGGTQTFISMELDHLGIEVPGDPSALKTYLLVFNSHDGSRPVEAHVTHVRTVCRNTAELARKGAVSSFRVRHSGTVDGKLTAARTALGIAFKNTEWMRELTTQLATQKLTDERARRLLEDVIFPLPADLRESSLEKHHSQQALALYHNSPNLEGIRGTEWGLFNAVTEYLDHGVAYHGRHESDEDAKAHALLFGKAKLAKDRALEALLAV